MLPSHACAAGRKSGDLRWPGQRASRLRDVEVRLNPYLRYALSLLNLRISGDGAVVAVVAVAVAVAVVEEIEPASEADFQGRQ